MKPVKGEKNYGLPSNDPVRPENKFAQGFTLHSDETIAGSVLNILGQNGLDVLEHLRLQGCVKTRLLKRVQLHIIQQAVVVKIAYLR